MIKLPNKRLFSFFIVAILFLIFLFNYQQLWSYLFDDVFISMRYARNFLEGNGLIYNLGERVEGYTNFLWVMLMVLFFLSGNFLFSLKFFVLGCVLISVWLTYLIAERVYRNTLVSLGTILLMTGNMYYVYHAAEGLETILFSALILWGTYWFILEEESSERSFYYNSATPLVLTYLTRPDGLMMVGVFGLVKLIRVVTEKKIRSSDYVWVGIIVGAIALHLVWRINYYGQLWPNSYYAKKMGFYYLPKGFEALQKLNLYFGFFWSLPLVLLSIFNRKNRHWTILFLAIVLTRVLFILFSGGSWVGMGGRFFVPAFPFFLMLFWVGLDKLSRFCSQILPRKRQLARALLIIVIVLSVNYLMPRVNREVSSFFILYAKGLKQAQMKLGIWLKNNASADDVIAVQDAGATPYYSELKTIDLLGLNSKHIAQIPGVYYYRKIGNYVLKENPTYIVINSNLYALMNPLTFADQEIFLHPDFIRRYKLIKRYIFQEDYYLFLYQRILLAE